MKHKVDYSENINGLTYTIVTEDYFQPVLDLFFDVFVKGLSNQSLQPNRSIKKSHFR